MVVAALLTALATNQVTSQFFLQQSDAAYRSALSELPAARLFFADPAARRSGDDRFRARMRDVAAHDGIARRAGVESPRLELAMGHALFMSGDLPGAILAYRRGLRLAPGDAPLESALAYARSRVEYPPNSNLAAVMRPEREYWPAWLELHRVGWVAFAAYAIACCAATRWRMTRGRGWLWVAGVAVVVALVPAVGTSVEWLRRQRDAAAPVVVLARAEVLRVGNGTEYPPRLDAPLPRGAEVRRLFERGGWIQVELSGGVVGWLPRGAVTTDE